MSFANLISSKWRIKLREIEDQMRRMRILKKINKQLNSLKFCYRKLSYDHVWTVYKIWSRCSIYSLWEKKFEIFFFDQIFCLLSSFCEWLKKYQSSNFIRNTKDLKQDFHKFIQNNMNAIEFNSIHRFENKIKFR